MARALKSGIRSEFFQSVRRASEGDGRGGSSEGGGREEEEEEEEQEDGKKVHRIFDGMSPVSHPKWRGVSVEDTHTSEPFGPDRGSDLNQAGRTPRSSG